MNYTEINLDLQSVVKRCYYNLLYRSSFMNFLDTVYIGEIRQAGTPMIEIVKQSATPTNATLNQPDLTARLDPALANYGSIKVDLAELRLDYSFRVSYLLTQGGMKKAIDGQIELQDSVNARKIDEYGYNKFNDKIVGSADGTLAYEKGQITEWNMTTKEEYIQKINSLKAILFDRDVYENYILGLTANEYANFISALTTILKYETYAGVEGVDRGEVANAYGVDIFEINSNVIGNNAVKGYFGHTVGTVGDVFFTQFNEFNGSYPGFPGYYVVEGVALFGAEVVRPEVLIKLINYEPKTLNGGTFDEGTVNTEYTQTTAFVGDDISKYIAIGLPDGLDINATTGEVSGTPTTAGTYPVNVYGIDENGNYTNAYKGDIVIA